MDYRTRENESMRKLNSEKTVALDDVTCGGMASKIFKNINEFGKANRINSGNFNATTVKFAEKFGNPSSHLFLFCYIYLLRVNTVTVTR